MSTLDRQCAFVTGAGGGIGRATAFELARRGARVAIHYSTSEREALQTAADCGKILVVTEDRFHGGAGATIASVITRATRPCI